MKTYFDCKYGENFSHKKTISGKSKSTFTPFRNQQKPCVTENINPWENE